jgi:uncharacterized Rmd1/YagE family protein
LYNSENNERHLEIESRLSVLENEMKTVQKNHEKLLQDHVETSKAVADLKWKLALLLGGLIVLQFFFERIFPVLPNK